MAVIALDSEDMSDFWTFDGIDDDETALVVPGSGRMSYGEVSKAADAWTAELSGRAGDLRPLVALEFTTTTDAVAAYLGVLRAGFPLLIVEPGKLAPETALAQQWRPDILLVAGGDDVTSIVERSGWREEVAALPPPDPTLRILLSTSGSTGDPKLVRLSRGNVSANARSIAEYLRLRPSDRAATTLPFFYSYGLSVLNSYLTVGAALVLTGESITEPSFWATARQARVTSLAFVPHQFDLLSAGGFDGTELPTLRYITEAGGRLEPDAVRRFWELGKAEGWELFVMYGQTEAAPRISYVPPGALPEAGDTIGRAVPQGRLWLADDDGREILEVGRPGELIYEGPNVMMGYATSRQDLARGAELHELRTGDVAERTAAGYFRMVGRLKRFVKLYGLRLSLDQIEALLRSKGISAHAVAVEDRLVLLSRSPAGVAAAGELVAEEYGIPAHAVHTELLAELPLLASGKIDGQALRQVAEEVLHRSDRIRDEAKGQASILEVMRDVTRQPLVRPTDTFVSLGGDSLSSLEMQMQLDDRLGAAPPGWERLTVAELEDLVHDGVEHQVGGTVRVSVSVEVLLRLLAITIIVVQHASNYPIFGGAWILLAVMGFSAARFQVDQIATGRPARLVRKMLYPIVPLYFLALVAYALVREPAPLRYWLLIGNYEPWTGGSVLVVYWFVSVYVQIVLLLALVAAVPPTRHAVVEDRWRAATVAACGLLIALLITVLLDRAGGVRYIPQRGFVECLSIFVVGWLLQSMSGRSRGILTVLLAAGVLSLLLTLDMTGQVLVTLVVALVLLGLRSEVRVPRVVARGLNELASLTLYVFLVHPVVISALSSVAAPPTLAIGLALVLSFVVAAAAKRTVAWVDKAVVGSRRDRMVRA